MCRVRYLTLSLLATLASAMAGAPVTAQAQTGAVAGRIVDASSGQPLPDVTVRAGGRQALSGTDGRYLLLNVPVGSQTVRATRLGYAEASETADVVAGQTAVVDFRMLFEAVALEGVVVVGYGERAERDLTGVVEAVASEEFNRGRQVSVEELIQAKVPGVQVINSGEPGGGTSIRIRGGTSVTSSNEPLFVLDGVPLQVGGGISAGRNPLNFLNPDDIESVTVLKDASATAIYGSRGANGVIMIETKKGQAGSRFTYTGSASGSTVVDDADILDAAQFRQVVRERAPQMMGALGSVTTDWQDQIQRTAAGQEHTLALSGGTDATNYRVSLGYLNQEGVIDGTETERLSASLNFNHRILEETLEGLTIGANLKGSRTEDDFTPGAVLNNAAEFAPTQPIRDDLSPFGGFFEWDDALGVNNPIAELELARDDGFTFRSVGDVTTQYRPPFFDGLSGTLRLGYDVIKTERRTFAPSFLRGQAETGLPGMIERRNETQVNRLLDFFVDYEPRFSFLPGEVKLTGGYSHERSRSDFPRFTAQGLSFDALGQDGVPSAELERSFLTVDETRLISGFGRLEYGYGDRYLLTLSVRRDGSSKFGPGQQWGTFPSAAVAWRLSEESFLKDRGPLSDLKLRVSWGKNGNQAFPSFQAFKSFQISDPLARPQLGDDFVTTLRPSAADPDIKWEETTSWNVGLDFGVLDNRVTGSIEWYTKDTDDLIFNVPVAAGTNLSNFVTTNIGSLDNDGVELRIDARILDGGSRGLTWDANVNVATNDNEITRINPFGGGERILTGDIAGGVGSRIQVLQPGQPINAFFVFKHQRDANGRPIYEDANGDGTIDDNDLYEDLNGDGLVNQDDRRPFGDPAPDWIVGHTSRIGWRRFDLSFTLLAYLGNQVYNNVASDQGNFRALAESQAPRNLHVSAIENRFEAPQFFSDVYVEDAGFLRMDNISLGYTFDRGRLAGTRIFGTVQNPFTLSDYSGVDPLAGVNGIDNNIFPRSRTFSAGITVGF